MRKVSKRMLAFALACAAASVSPAGAGLQARAQTAASRQQQDSAEALAGRYAGLSKSTTEGDMPLKMRLRSEGGNLTGEVETQFGKFPIVGGSYAGGHVEMKFSAGAAEGTVSGEYRDGRLTGSWSLGGSGGALDLRKVSETAREEDYWPSSVPRLTPAQWRADLRYMAEELPRRHKNAFHLVTREQFARAVAQLDAEIPRLRGDEIMVGMARVVAMIGDGHTYFSTGNLYSAYPVGLYWFGDELRVTRAARPYERALGARVVAVGGKDIREVRRALDRLIPQGENEWFVRRESVGHLRQSEELRALGIVPNVERARWTFVDDRGRRFTLVLRPTREPDDKIAWLSASSARPPLASREPGDPMWFTYLPDSQTVYFNFRSYPDEPEFRRKAGELFKLIDSNPTRRLVIDLRQNGGGDFTKGRELLIPGLKERGFGKRPGSLYVLTGRVTFSAAMVNAVDFRKELHAILVGEPTGARPNSYSENRYLILPNSHLTVSYSIRYYQFADAGEPAVMPDKRIDPAWADFRAGRDSALEWILGQKTVDSRQ